MGDRDHEAPGPIYFSAIDALARRMGIEGRDEFAAFEHLIRECDRVWIEDAARRRKEARDAAEAEAEAARRR